MPTRRALIAAPLAALVAGARAADDAAALQALRAGGVVIAFRHALAPGTYDPPGFRIDDCATQRNLNDEGRAHAAATGDWMRRHRLAPRHVRSSPWCRCLETARLAFGAAEPWPALGSPRASAEATSAQFLDQLRRAVHAASRERGFAAWVSHQFVLNALAGTAAVASGEGLVLRAPTPERVEVVARLLVA